MDRKLYLRGIFLILLVYTSLIINIRNAIAQNYPRNVFLTPGRSGFIKGTAEAIRWIRPTLRRHEAESSPDTIRETQEIDDNNGNSPYSAHDANGDGVVEVNSVIIDNNADGVFSVGDTYIHTYEDGYVDSDTWSNQGWIEKVLENYDLNEDGELQVSELETYANDLGDGRNWSIAGWYPVDDYYPLTEGSKIRYNVSEIEGTWDSDSMMIDIASSRPDGEQVLVYSVDTENFSWACRITYTKNGEEGGSLYDGGGEINGVRYIGEVMNPDGWRHYPPIAKITRDPVEGEVIEGTTHAVKVNDDGITEEFDMKWEYKTVAHYDRYEISPGKWIEDVWVTTLVEYDKDGVTPRKVYNYVFKKGVGMVKFTFLCDLEVARDDEGTFRVTGHGYEYTGVGYHHSWMSGEEKL